MKVLESWTENRTQSPEQVSALIAAGTSWVVGMVGLHGWSLFKWISQGALSPAFILLSIHLMVYFGTLLYLRNKPPSTPES